MYFTMRFKNTATGETRDVEFLLPHGGFGYLRFADCGTQVCEHLSRRGDTLTASSVDSAKAIIRRERRKALRAGNTSIPGGAW